MKFSLNHYLLGLSLALDCVESELLGVATGHGKRVAYVSMRMAHAMGLSDTEVFDIAAFAVLHDNGLAEESLTNGWVGADRLFHVEDLPAHCNIGESNIAVFPFQTGQSSIIKYHHEQWNGSGFFGLSGQEIPLMAQIVGLADYADLKMCLGNPVPATRERVLSFLTPHQKEHWSVFAHAHRMEECGECNEFRLVCDAQPVASGHGESGRLMRCPPS